jgi:NitT/TauT family transport system permease protein
MIGSPIKARYQTAFGLLSVVILVGIYSFLSARQHAFNPTDSVIPNARQFAEGVVKVCGKDVNGHRWIVDDLIASGTRFGLGISCGIFLSVTVGMSMACYSPAAAMLLPPITFLSKIPPTAMLALYFVVFGTDLQLFVAIIALGIFPSLAIGIYSAVKTDVPQELIFKAFTLGSSNMEVVYEVVFKQILPRILLGIELVIGPAMVFLIATEWVMSDIGFGYRLRMQARLLNMNVVYFYLILLGLIGYLMDRGLTGLRRWLCPWFIGA